MNRTDTFLSCLKHWDETTENKSMTLDSINFHLGYILGLGNESLKATLQDINDRIVYLTTSERVQGKFLIYSLINEVENLFKHDLNHLGEAIITNEAMNQSYLDEFGVVPDHVKSALERLKSKEHIFKCEHQLDSWRIIISTQFTISKERQWSNEEFLKQAKSL